MEDADTFKCSVLQSRNVWQTHSLLLYAHISFKIHTIWYIPYLDESINLFFDIAFPCLELVTQNLEAWPETLDKP